MAQTQKVYPITTIYHNGSGVDVEKARNLLAESGFVVCSEESRSFTVATKDPKDGTPALIGALLASVFVVSLQHDGVTRKWIGYSII